MVMLDAPTSAPAPALKPSEWADREHPDVLCLFDVDGTLSPSRQVRAPPP